MTLQEAIECTALQVQTLERRASNAREDAARAHVSKPYRDIQIFRARLDENDAEALRTVLAAIGTTLPPAAKESP